MFKSARVLDVHPESNSIDVVFLSDGRPLSGVRMFGPSLSGNTGLVDIPVPDLTKPRGDTTSQTTYRRDMIAAIGWVDGVPACFGFSAPSVSEMCFPAAVGEGRRIDRHASDVYETIDKDGNYEKYHPSGTYLRIGTSSAHDDLTGRDYNGNWKIGRNTDKAVHVHLTVANAGSVVCTLDIDPSGNIALQHVGNLTTHTQGNADITVDGTTTATLKGNTTANVTGTVNLTATGNVTSTAPLWTHNGNFTVNGFLTGTAGFAFSGSTGGGPTGYVTGAIHFNGVQITADGGSTMSFNGKRIDDTLRVSSVQTGTGTSGTPV